jgi:hypothetical protein
MMVPLREFLSGSLHNLRRLFAVTPSSSGLQALKYASSRFQGNPRSIRLFKLDEQRDSI